MDLLLQEFDRRTMGNPVRVLLHIERCQVDCFLMGGVAAVLRLVDGTKLVDLLLQEFDRGILGPR